MNPLAQSPQIYTRIAGICYLLIILLGIFGQIIVRNSLVVMNDATMTVNNIAESSQLWRLGIVGDITMHLLDIPLMVILYLLLRPVHKTIALMALGFNVIQTAVLATNKLTLIIPLLLISSQQTVVFTPEQINAQIMLLLDVHNYGFALGLIFFGCACLGYGYLLFKSGYFPKPIGILILVAGLCYLINSFVLMLVPALSSYTFLLLGVCLIAELSLCLRLLFFGVDLPVWTRAQTSNDC